MVIDINKKYRTRDGNQVRFYATDGAKGDEIHGAMLKPDGWVVACWNKNGRYFSHKNSDEDLIEVKPSIQREYWVNLYEDERKFYAYLTKTDADIGGNDHRIACVKLVIDCEKGEGL